MSLAMITLLPLLVGFGFLYWASLVDEEHEFLRTVFQLMFIPLSLVSINFALIDASMVYASNAELVTRLTDLVFYIGWLFWGIGVYMAFMIMKRLWDMVQQKKADKQEEKYG